MVKEFYANVEEKERDYVFVRGKKVWFGRTSINKFFELNDLETLKCNAIMGKEFDA